MNMEIRLTSDEVNKIVKKYSENLLAGYLTDKHEMEIRGGYSSFTINITEKEEPEEMEKTAIIDKLESGDHAGLQTTIEEA